MPLPLTRLADWRQPDWQIDTVRLHFSLDPDRTLVETELAVRRRGVHQRPLLLDGEALETLSLAIDGVPQPLPAGDGPLALAIAADRATVTSTVALSPRTNHRLMGLYSSGGHLLTQCEAEGFRRITWFPDRPDMLARWHVTLDADRAAFPVLLSNGDLVAEADLGGGRHRATWRDPHGKPSYLFALFAGRMDCLHQRVATASGRAVDLRIWAEPADLPRCGHAMASLVAALRFDEQAYGREYDLDRFNLVAVRDFNFGAMENKGLNIFNARYVLADPDTATDQDYAAIAAVVAHEYFHNWSGNRVTCRDWFQLCLKEGFTVFRDQQFSEWLGPATVRRIEAIRTLRAQQFPEDDGPMAHPVRPGQYREISNFYTATVYNKGAELVRMIHRLMGAAAFRRATDRYFADHDGRAATLEDFLAAMEAEGLDTPAFRAWYDVAGTPRLSASLTHDPAARTATVTVRQANPRAPEAAPLMPLALALFAPDGRLMASADTVLNGPAATLRFDGIDAAPMLSLNRGFAAPVLVEPAPDRATLALMARAEPDPVARHDALQELMLAHLVAAAGSSADTGEDVLAAVAATLGDAGADPAFVAETILPPAESQVADRMAAAVPPAIHAAREALRRRIGETLAERLWRAFAAGAAADPASTAARDQGLRRLRAVALGFLAAGGDDRAIAAARDEAITGTTMTARHAALAHLAHRATPARDEALAAFLDRHRHQPEVVDKWFAVQAASTLPDTLAAVTALESHPLFDPLNPNRLRALVLGFALNQPRFHGRGGEGADWLATRILATDARNPQAAARLAGPLTRWRRFADPWGAAMRAALERIAGAPGLSRDVAEVVQQSLAA